MTDKKKDKQAPKLRFPEFDDGWDFIKMENLSDKISDGIHSTPKYNNEGNYFFINGNNLINGKIYIDDKTKRVTKDEYFKHKRELEINTILLSINGTIGNLAFYNNEKVILGKSACYINIKKDIDKNFVFNSLQLSKTQNYFNTELTGSTIKNLSLKTIKTTVLSIPTLPEQKKIAAFLTAVDKKIQQLTRKKELLEKYKKGVMQKIFSQEIRFKDNEGKDFPGWEEKRLGEVAEIIMGQSPDSKNYSDDPTQTVLIQGNADLNKGKVIPRLYTSEITKVSNKGDIIMTVRAPVGDLAISEYDTCIGRGVCAIKANYFIFHLLIYFKIIGLWTKYSQGSTIDAVSSSDIKGLLIKMPLKDEQEKIDLFLTRLNNKIETVEIELQKTQTFKKGLLQQMFV